ncbi:methyltransferase domain-containing protein [Saccharothrix luteola]|uniref:methyltransferase domain-containing protein n=1 Tax=Saccharothrix luteola TaxID=2893018 RepID=UPI001E2A2971|nr:methyltransferase domain-containing protein [Saccharothrix luteola]MCC8247604.1 methyltransferase domain-containing protein [Saccharothrix luteola]
MPRPFHVKHDEGKGKGMYEIRPGVLSTMGHPYSLDHIAYLATAGVEVIVCALTETELAELDLADEPEAARDAGITFHWLPIPDFGIPATTPNLDPVLRDMRAGRHVVVHCWAGIGRSSLLAGALLVLDGASPEAAWQAISEARGRDVPESDEQRAWLTTFAQARFWDAQAATFDEDADHGLRDPAVRRAWADVLLPRLPPAPASVVDLGCGTGSLAALLAEAGHHVAGLDLSERMLAPARAKAPGIDFRQGDAAHPPYPPGSFDVVLARHVLWALPDPAAALDRWRALLKPNGRLILVEGRWSTGAGLTAAECVALLGEGDVHPLTDPTLWGREITDERYLVVA